MCKLLVALTKTPNNPEYIKIIQLQYNDLRTQPNGIGALVIDQNDKCHIFRELKDYQKVFDQVDKLLPTAKLVSLHSRISTGGNVDINNVHFFERNNHVLAHNGWITGYSTTTKPPYCYGCETTTKIACKRHIKKPQKIEQLPGIADCDTLQFLTDLTNLNTDITPDAIDSLAIDKNFSGVALLFDKSTNQATLFSRNRERNPIQAITDNKTFGVFFSYQPTTKAKRSFSILQSVFGVSVIQQEQEQVIETTLESKDVPDGCYQLTNTIADTAETYETTPEPQTESRLLYQPPASSFIAYNYPSDSEINPDITCDSCGITFPAEEIEYIEDYNNEVCQDCYTAYTALVTSNE